MAVSKAKQTRGGADAQLVSEEECPGQDVGVWSRAGTRMPGTRMLVGNSLFFLFFFFKWCHSSSSQTQFPDESMIGRLTGHEDVDLSARLAVFFELLHVYVRGTERPSREHGLLFYT